jgi:hypothetical protein
MRFIIQEAKQKPDAYVCTDTENGIVCQFDAHKFNDTQKFTFLEDVTQPDALAIARLMREMGDWLAQNHYEKVF